MSPPPLLAIVKRISRTATGHPYRVPGDNLEAPPEEVAKNSWSICLLYVCSRRASKRLGAGPLAAVRTKSATLVPLARSQVRRRAASGARNVFHLIGLLIGAVLQEGVEAGQPADRGPTGVEPQGRRGDPPVGNGDQLSELLKRLRVLSDHHVDVGQFPLVVQAGPSVALGRAQPGRQDTLRDRLFLASEACIGESQRAVQTSLVRQLSALSLEQHAGGVVGGARSRGIAHQREGFRLQKDPGVVPFGRGKNLKISAGQKLLCFPVATLVEVFEVASLDRCRKRDIGHPHQRRASACGRSGPQPEVLGAPDVRGDQVRGELHGAGKVRVGLLVAPETPKRVPYLHHHQGIRRVCLYCSTLLLQCQFALARASEDEAHYLEQFGIVGETLLCKPEVHERALIVAQH